MRFRWLMIAGLLAFLVFQSGCSSLSEKKGWRGEESLVWPPPPRPSRILYLGSISELKDIGGNESFLRRAWKGIVGKGEPCRIDQPYGIAVQGKKIYVVDTSARVVWIFDEESRKCRRISRAGENQLISPIGVALNPEGNFYLSDSELGRVFAYSPEGKFLFEIGSGEELERPTGLAVNVTNRLLYVVDTRKHQVIVFNLEGKRQFSFGNRGKEDGEFNFPTNIFIDAQGDIYITDFMNFRVQIFDPEGGFITKFGVLGDRHEDLDKPKGIAVDREGHIYVVDTIHDLVKIFDREGKLLLFFGGSGSGAGELWLPSGLFIDHENKIYVADSFNHRVQIYQYLPEDWVSMP